MIDAVLYVVEGGWVGVSSRAMLSFVSELGVVVVTGLSLGGVSCVCLMINRPLYMFGRVVGSVMLQLEGFKGEGGGVSSRVVLGLVSGTAVVSVLGFGGGWGGWGIACCMRMFLVCILFPSQVFSCTPTSRSSCPCVWAYFGRGLCRGEEMFAPT